MAACKNRYILFPFFLQICIKFELLTSHGRTETYLRCGVKYVKVFVANFIRF